MKQLLLNLAVNACEAIGDHGGHLIFSLYTSNDDGTVTLRVEDDGEGLSVDQAKHIYKPFYSTKKQGTGLGLAIVHRICSALKLGLGVDSLPGEGTTFSIVFRLFKLQIRPSANAVPEELESARS